MSHNWRAYKKKIRANDARSTVTLTNYFKKGRFDDPAESLTPSTAPIITSKPTEPKSSANDPAVATASSASVSPAAVSPILSSSQSTPPEQELSINNIDKAGTEHDLRRFSVGKYESKFSWLYYSGTQKGYICKYCELFAPKLNKSTPYITCGAVLGEHPTRRLEIHEKSQSHKNSLSRYTSSLCNVNIARTVMQTYTTSEDALIAKNRNYLKKLFKTCGFMIKKKWALSENFKDVVQFMGTTCDPDIVDIFSGNTTYTSSTSVTEIIGILSDYLENKLLTDLRGKKFTLLADESTDQANRTQLSVFARWVGNGEVKESYMGLINVERTSSAALMDGIRVFCLGKGIELRNIRFVGLDGCNAMSGENKGLQKRIRHESPLSIYVNCRNHRLALCLVHMVKRNQELEEVDRVLLGIYKMFHYSPKKAAVFEAIQGVYGQKPLKFIRAATTRWLSHLRASVRFVGRFEAILDTLDSLIEETKEPELTGIRISMTQPGVILTVLVLVDILKPVNFLSLYLQEDCGTFTELPARVTKCRNELQEVVNKYESCNYQELEFGKCQELLGVVRDRTDLARRMRADDRDMNPDEFLRLKGVPMVYDLINEIADAFCNHSAVLSAFSVLDPGNLPDSVTEIAEYGKNHTQTLAEFYGKEQHDEFQGHRTVAPPELDSTEIVTNELNTFKPQLFMYKQRGDDSVTKVYRAMERDPVIRACFPRVYKLFKLALLIPQSTAVVERGFSVMNDICTFLRTSMGQITLDAMMRISLMQDTLQAFGDEDYENLVSIFKDKKKREMKL